MKIQNLRCYSNAYRKFQTGRSEFSLLQSLHFQAERLKLYGFHDNYENTGSENQVNK